ncbi:glutamate receptor 2.7-like [Macadamia integrifolia]|uniref:glutamate receptor 2.7-like n=1 Tax=Macadamia integrifolia TaxID=60698 RepID=UPI001C4FF1CA|nr:glutamate receptor 2.7-like [Macadamia integrifolia]
MYSATHLLFFILLHIFLVFHGSPAETVRDGTRTAKLGAIIDANSSIGKELKTSMDIAIEILNKSNNHFKLELHVNDSGGDPFQATSAAEELVKKHKVEAILGMETWQETELVAEIGNRAGIPVFSFATTSVPASLTTKQWPFLVRMTHNEATHMKCVAAIVGAHNWKKVTVIYEDDTYGSNSGLVMLLYDALRDVGSQVEYQITALSDPNTISKELEMLNSARYSRVFILVQPSVSFCIHVFGEARGIGLMGNESVWITTNTIASTVFDSFNSSVISSMQDVLGIKTYFSTTSPSFKGFDSKFSKKFHSEYPEEDKLEPGIHAVRAYDAIFTLTSKTTTTSNSLRDKILSSNFSGLSGEIQFKDGELSKSPVFQIVNVKGKSYKELDFWTPECGFSESLGHHQCNGTNYTMKGMSGPVDWPGRRQMPLKIGVPGETVFKEIVEMEWNSTLNKFKPKGFCIDVFEAAVEILKKNDSNKLWEYEYERFNGTYDELILQVYNKTYDAVVGDMSILANRSNYVKFTWPFIESGLSLIIPVNKESQAWMFMMPFTSTMWIVIGLVLLYTTLVIWFVEHPSNADFGGSWKDQLGTALWFTFSTFFFAQREKLNRNFSRFAVAIWLFVVLILSNSYSANRTSMLTVQRLKPTMSDVEILKKNNSSVGCDNKTFAKKYLVDVLGFMPDNIRNFTIEDNYTDEFKQGNIKGAFLELPNAKVFLNKYGNKYTSTTQPIYRFGGWGFVFPLGSTLADNFSNAILELLENGNIKNLENTWLCGNTNCSKSGTAEVEDETLGLDSFWGLFLLTTGTSTIVFLLFLIINQGKEDLLHRKDQHPKDQDQISEGPPASSAQTTDDRDLVPPESRVEISEI